MSWVLVELPMDQMRIPIATMSAYVETPFDALAGVVFDDWLPIQGVAYDRGTADNYVVDAVLAFPPQDGANVATVNEEKKIFSLLVNLAQFSPGDVIRIGLYGIVFSYNIVGGLGDDGPLRGTIFSSTFYGAVTYNFDTLDGTAWHPSDLVGCPRKLYIDSGLTGFGQQRLVSSFPELATMPFAYTTHFTGQYEISVSFDHQFPPPDQHWGAALGTVIGAWWSIDAASIPTLVPNSWILRDPVAIWDFSLPIGVLSSIPLTHTDYWGGAHEKTATIDCSIMKEGDATVTSVPTPPLLDPLTGNVRVDNIYQVKYYCPTWHFDNDRTVPVNVSTSGAILWTKQAEHDYPRPAHSLTWETNDYPTRPEMAEIATAIIPSLDDRLDPENPYNDYPFNHFGEPRVGTITIIMPDSPAGTPAVSFAPEDVPPADGTPDGDGPIGDGTAPGRTDNPVLRVWTFSLDDHDYYVLRLGDFDQLVWDSYSEQWMDWNDFNSLTWRAQCGINWVGAEALADTYGSNVVAGDDTYGLLWFLDPEQPFDNDALGSVTPIYFSRVTMGQVPLNGREVLPCHALWLTADMGAPAYSGAAVTLWTSDDAGKSWDNQGFVKVTANENAPELSWYSLGQIAAPGRLFKIFDNGAITRIDALEMNDPDAAK